MNSALTLTPRQTRLALDLLSAAVVISVAFALAGLTWRIAGHAGTGAITVPSGKSAPAGTGIGPAVALAPFGQSAGADASQATSLPITLKGIVFANPASLSSAFIATGSEPAVAYSIGQNVGGATIRAIQRDRVILENAGRAEFLGFPVPEAPEAAPTGSNPIAQPAPGAPAAAPPPAPSAPAVDPAQGVAPLLQQLGASPAEGGYRIGTSAVPGMLPGDVLVSLNGTALSDPTAAGAAYASAQASGSATLQILRNGKRMTLTVPLR